MKYNLHESIYKVLSIIGCPNWLHGTAIGVQVDGEPVIKILVNKKVGADELERVPTIMDGLQVQIVYRNPIYSLIP